MTVHRQRGEESPLPPLSDEQIRRYSRQLLLPELDGPRQKRLLGAVVALGGDGAAAEVCATYLAAAGVGTIVMAQPSTRAQAINPDTRIVSPPAPPQAIQIRVPRAESPSGAWIQGSFAAVEALKRLLDVGAPAPPRLDLR